MAKPGALVKRGRGAVMPPPLTVTQLLLDVSLVRLLLAVLGVAFRPLQVSGPRRLGALARPVPRLLSGVGSPRIACYAGIERGAKKRNRAAGADTPAVRAPAPSCPRAPPHPHPTRTPRCLPAGARGAGVWQWRCGALCCAQLATWPRRRARGRCAS